MASDRCALSGTVSGPVPPLSSASQHRDAPKVWSQPATKIAPPGSGLRRPSNVELAGGHYNNTRDTLGPRSANPVASKTLVRESIYQPPSKRRRLTESTSAPKVMRKGPILAPENEVIVISDEEDLGTLIERGSSSSLVNSHFDLFSHPTKSQISITGLPGPSTRLLEGYVKSKRDKSSPITSFDDVPISAKALEAPPKSVKTLVNTFETMTTKPIPMLNLRNLPKKKDALKGKTVVSKKNTVRIPPSRDTAQVTLTAMNNKFISNSKKPPDKTIKIPVDVAYIFSQKLDHIVLVWDQQSKLFWVEGDHVKTFEPTQKWESKWNPKMARMELTELERGPTIISLTFEGGRISFKINLRHPACFPDDFNTLLADFRSSVREWTVVRNDTAHWNSIEQACQFDQPGSSTPGQTPAEPSKNSKNSNHFDVDVDMEPGNAVYPEKRNGNGNQVGRSTKYTAPLPTRRSARQAESDLQAEHDKAVVQASQPRPPIERPEEVILVYPWGMPGAVNLNRGDLARLLPNEFLNDNLIEFGLKLWLTKLETVDLELFKDVYVFSSFFYGKLKTKKGDEWEGYQQVRRWTSKVDIFSKRYLVVPINENYHWYLAIICNPAHVLLPPPPPLESPSTRTRTRQAATELSLHVEKPPPSPPPVDTTSGIYSDDPIDLLADAKDSAEVADMIRMSQDLDDMVLSDKSARAFTPERNAALGTTIWSSPLTSTPPTPSTSKLDGDGDANMDLRCSDTESEGATTLLQDISQTASDIIRPSLRGRARRLVPESDDENTDDVFTLEEHRVEELKIRGAASNDQLKIRGAAAMDMVVASNSDVIAPATFYGTAKRKKRKMDQIEDADTDVEVEVLDVDAGPMIVSPRLKKYVSKGRNKAFSQEQPVRKEPPQPTTMILTIDSLGSKHGRVVNTLAAYLSFEAKDKGRSDNPSKAVGRAASVPVQPNFCDCGLYLIHFVETFMSDPEFYETASVKKPDWEQVKKDWHVEKIPQMREELTNRVEKLSEEWRAWKEEKATEGKDKAKDDATVIDSSDSEVDIVETILAADKQKGKGRSGKGKAKAK